MKGLIMDAAVLFCQAGTLKEKKKFYTSHHCIKIGSEQRTAGRFPITHTHIYQGDDV